MTPCEVSVKDTRVNDELNELAVSCVEKFTDEPLRRMEKGFVFGSSDFGDVSYEAPAIQLLCKAGDYPDPLGGLHAADQEEEAGLLSEAYERLICAYQEAREINDELEELLKNCSMFYVSTCRYRYRRVGFRTSRGNAFSGWI